MADTTPSPATDGPPDDVEQRDPSLARERTELAWTRTAISFAALGAAMLRDEAAIGATVLAIAAAVWMLGHLSAREAIRAARHGPVGRPWTMGLITAATTLVALVALLLVLLAPIRIPSALGP